MISDMKVDKYISEKTSYPSPKVPYILEYDGSCWPNPGPMQVGYIIKDIEGNAVVKAHRKLGMGTNNEAELWAVYYGMCHCIRLGLLNIVARGDNMLSCQLIRQQWKIKAKHKHLIKALQRIFDILPIFSAFSIGYIQRKQNWEADLWSKNEQNLPDFGPSGIRPNENKNLFTPYQACLIKLIWKKNISRSQATLSRIYEQYEVLLRRVALDETYSYLKESSILGYEGDPEFFPQ